jgi:hypothetical protein
VLSLAKENDLAEIVGTFPGLNLGWDISKPFFDRNVKASGIIIVE